MTSYDEIYNRFLSKIDDYDIYQLLDEEAKKELEKDTDDEDIDSAETDDIEAEIQIDTNTTISGKEIEIEIMVNKTVDEEEDDNGYSFVESMLLDFLNSGLSLYTYQTQDMEQRDDTLKSFTIKLTNLEQEILSEFMVVSYLTPKLIRSDMIEHRLTSKDLREFSPAILMREIRKIKNDSYDRAHGLMTENYIRMGF